jgi:hypothetical protein
MLLSVIISCYNEEVVSAETHRRLTGVLQKQVLIMELSLLTTTVKTAVGFLILNPKSYA